MYVTKHVCAPKVQVFPSGNKPVAGLEVVNVTDSPLVSSSPNFAVHVVGPPAATNEFGEQDIYVVDGTLIGVIVTNTVSVLDCASASVTLTV